jgi:hypothetical protein
MSENESKNKFEALMAGMSTAQHSALVVLLDRLRADIARKDGDAAVRTMELIWTVAGHDYAVQLTDILITAGIRRISNNARS